MPSLCFLRHAEAVPSGEGRFDHDSERPLSEHGRDMMKAASRGIRKLDLDLARICTSPYLRARQTAEIVAAELGLEDRVETVECLASGAHWSQVRRLVLRPGSGSTLLVGHEPDMSSMTCDLLGAERGAVRFATGTLAVVAVEAMPPDGEGRLSGLHTAAELARLGD